MRHCLPACLLSLALCGCHHRVPPPAISPPPAQAAPESQPPPRKRDRPAARPTAPPPAVNAPELKLGRALSPDEQRARNLIIDRHLANAQRLLGSLVSKGLTTKQREAFTEIQSFIVQTEKMRTTDLVGAGSLAERAEVLAADLAKSVK